MLRPATPWFMFVDGEAQITIGGAAHTVPAGSAIIMPAGIPHAVQARTPFKKCCSRLSKAN